MVTCVYIGILYNVMIIFIFVILFVFGFYMCLSVSLAVSVCVYAWLLLLIIITFLHVSQSLLKVYILYVCVFYIPMALVHYHATLQVT